MERDPALIEALRAAGGPVAVGIKLAISSQAISQWRRCPVERVLDLERLTEGVVTRYQLRPDIYPPEQRTRRRRVAS
jgi:DNA-binding transcriptional regulator YdaS (Cro superfamily)